MLSHVLFSAKKAPTVWELSASTISDCGLRINQVRGEPPISRQPGGRLKKPGVDLNGRLHPRPIQSIILPRKPLNGINHLARFKPFSEHCAEVEREDCQEVLRKLLNRMRPCASPSCHFELRETNTILSFRRQGICSADSASGAKMRKMPVNRIVCCIQDQSQWFSFPDADHPGKRLVLRMLGRNPLTEKNR